MQYIEAILKEILKYTPRDKDHGALFNLFPQLFDELQQLNPEDFAPRSRGVFMEVLRASKKWSTKTSFYDEQLVEAEQMAKDAIEVLGDHKQESGGTIRGFSFVIRHGIREIVARDYEDLERNLLPAGSWKCAVIACGSILEGVLFDVLTKTPAEVRATMASPKAPKKRHGVTRDITKDTFEDDCRSLQDEDVVRHLRLAGAKDKVAGFLLRLRSFRAKHG